MDVVVIGVGSAGEIASRLLATVDGIENLRLVDVRKDRLDEVAKKIDRKVDLLEADLERSEELRRSCRGADIIVNTAIPKYNLDLMEEAVRIKAHYLDLGSEGSPDPTEFPKIRAQLGMDEAFRKIGRLALLGMGVAPGITNLVGRHGAEPLDRVDAIRIRVYGSGYAKVKGHLFAPLFSPETFLEEVLFPAPVWKGDREEKLPPFSGEEEFRFPDPLGVGICYNVNNEETETMPKTLGKDVRFIDFKYALAPKRKVLLETLYRLGLTRTDPIEVDGAKVVPMHVLLALLPEAASLAGQAEGHTCVVVEVEGQQNGRHTGSRLWTIMNHKEAYKKMGVHATAFLTGTPPAAAVDALVQGEIDRHGVMAGDGLDPTPILRRAKALGVPLFEGSIGATRGRPLQV